MLFTKFFGGARDLTPHPPALPEMLRDHDAALLIGDAALQVPCDAGYHLYDLSHLWREQTGQAFVFAFWAVRFEALQRKKSAVTLARVFQQSRDHGLEPQNLEVIAKEWSPKVGLAEADIRGYLTANIHYYLDRENHVGLKLFAILPGDRTNCGSARPKISWSGGVWQRAEVARGAIRARGQNFQRVQAVANCFSGIANTVRGESLYTVPRGSSPHPYFFLYTDASPFGRALARSTAVAPSR